MTEAQEQALTQPVHVFKWEGEEYDLACYSHVERNGTDITLHSDYNGSLPSLSRTLKSYPGENLFNKVMASAPHLKPVDWQDNQ